MAIIINESKMLDENVYKYEQRLKSPTSRFLDVTPTLVTLYHINSDITTVDDGFKDISSLIGFRSPLRYNKIEKFPMYGLDQMVLQIQDNEQGLDSSFESDATIMHDTVVPLQNDMFIIPYLKDDYIFRINEVSYDTIMANNYRKISFHLEYIDHDKRVQLENQVTNEYNCVLENIGTENQCIIESSYKEKIDKIDALYDDIAETYMSLFYSDKHNCLLGDLDIGIKVYDPFQTEFINKHGIFNKKNNLETVILTDQVNDSKRRLKYEKSVYRFIERRDFNLVKNFTFDRYLGFSAVESTFNRWNDKTIYILDIIDMVTPTSMNIFSEEFVTSIKVNGFTHSKVAELIQKFVREDSKISINDIPMDLNEEIIRLNTSLEIFFFTPIILYIMKTLISEFLKKN